MGVKKEIVDRAIDFLSPETKRYQENLVQIEDIKAELRRMKEQLQLESSELRKQKQKYEALAGKFGSEKDKMLEQARVRAERKIERLIETAKVGEIFQKHENLEKVRSQLPEVVKAVPKALQPETKIDSPEAFAKAFPPGAKIYAPSIGKDAFIQGVPNARGEVPILSGPMRLMIPWDQLKPANTAQNQTFELVRRSNKTNAAMLDSDRIIDVRGKRVEEALHLLEEELDVASLQQEDRVKIIHGHGTDTLKKSIRSFLSRSLYIKKWQAGNADTGGDGVTWAEIKD